MDYPHARVRLHFCKVFDWRGEFEMREGQAMAWQTLPVAGSAGAARHAAGAATGSPPSAASPAPTASAGAAATLDRMNWLDDVKWDATAWCR